MTTPMGSAGPIDMVSLRPKSQSGNDGEKARDAAEEKTLRDQAEDLGLLYSEAGSKIRELVSNRLELRINVLVANDAEASAYMKILKEMGARLNIARHAVAVLNRKLFGDKITQGGTPP